MKGFRIFFFFFVLVPVFAQADFNRGSLPKYSPETYNLLCFLQKTEGSKVLFGHQDDLAYGIGWKYENGRSDVKELTGSYPAVFGWELGHLELDSSKSLDSVPFDKIRYYIQQVYAIGGINTISWHLNNPVNGATAWDTSYGTIEKILP